MAEAVWPALWLPAAILGVFLALALLDVPRSLGGWLHSALLALFALAFLFSAYRALLRLHRPDEASAKRRMEKHSGYKHRPLETLEDDLVSGSNDPQSQALWSAHLTRVAREVKSIRVGFPQTSWSAVDRLALRAPLALLLIVALAVGASNFQERLERAVTPSFASADNLPPPVLDIWINPPTYTGLPPVYLTQENTLANPQGDDDDKTEAGTAQSGAAPEPTDLIAGSQLLAQLQGSQEAPVLEVVFLDKDPLTFPFEAAGPQLFKLQQAIADGHLLTVRQGEELLASWPINVIPDEAPETEYEQPPARSARGSLQIEFFASDDFGLSEVVAEIRRSDEAGQDAEPLVLPLPVPGRMPASISETGFFDLTSHLWAGVPVEMTLVARDALGQEGRSDPFAMLMPERVFEHPVARLLVQLRKELTLNPNERGAIISALRIVQNEPAKFFHDIVVALALRSAERRLLYDLRPGSVPSVQQILWDTALHIEDGELSVAERELREAQRRLMEALANDAPDEEIERLMSELQQALDRFLQAMAEQALQDMAEGNMQPQEMPEGSEMVDRDQLQEMIDKARELARSGAKDQARDMLAQLQQMLENMQAGAMQPQLSPREQRAQEMMRGMEDLMQQQQQLLDRSFERSQQGRYGESQQGDSQTMNQMDSAAQEELRQRLGEIMRQFGDATGEIPRELGNAEQAMRNARDALRNNQPEGAVNPQGEALDQLQQGMRSMVEELARQQDGEGEGGESAQDSSEQEGMADPFARYPGDETQSDGVELPTEMELQRSREILRELRRRRLDQSRPPSELDYLDRLLRQF